MSTLDEYNTLTVTLEVVRCKKLWQDPDAPLTVSPVVYLDCVPEGGGNPIHFETNTKTEESDPFFSEAFDFKLGAQLLPLSNGHECNVPEVRIQYSVLDTVFDPPRLFSRDVLTIPSAVVQKGETLVTLKAPTPEESGMDVPEGSEQRGSMLIRYKTALPKVKVIDVNVDAQISQLPHFDSSVSLIPAVRRKAWMFLLEGAGGHHWRDHFEKKLVEAFKDTPKVEKKHPTKTAGDVVVLRWKVHRLHQFMSRLRYSVERYQMGEAIGGPPLPPGNEPPPDPASIILTGEEDPATLTEPVLKIKWKTDAALRLSIAQQRSNKVTELIDRLWLYYCADIPVTAPLSHVSFEQRTKMNATMFGRPQCEVLTACILQLFVPSFGYAQAEALAKEDYDFSPVTSAQGQEEEEKHAKDLKKAEDDGKDEIELMAEKQLAEQLGAPPNTAGNPTVSTDSFKLFQATLSRIASWWCETYTDTEYMNMLQSLGAAIVPAKLKLGVAAGETLKTPRSGRRKSSARRGSSRPGSAKTPRTPR